MENETLLLAAGAMLAFGIGGFLVKYALRDIQPMTLYLGEMAVALAALLIYILIKKPDMGFENMAAKDYGIILLIGMLFFIAILFMYYALVKGYASTVIPLVNLNMVIVVILAVLILKEKLTFTSSAGVALSVIAIYLLSRG